MFFPRSNSLRGCRRPLRGHEDHGLSSVNHHHESFLEHLLHPHQDAMEEHPYLGPQHPLTGELTPHGL
jgi:hypothetical protein